MARGYVMPSSTTRGVATSGVPRCVAAASTRARLRPENAPGRRLRPAHRGQLATYGRFSLVAYLSTLLAALPGVRRDWPRAAWSRLTPGELSGLDRDRLAALELADQLAKLVIGARIDHS